MVSGRPQFREQFFEARYNVALCRFLQGKAENSDRIIKQAASDITQVSALYPEMGGPQRRAQFDLLLKEIQKAHGEKPDGLRMLPNDVQQAGGEQPVGPPALAGVKTMRAILSSTISVGKQRSRMSRSSTRTMLAPGSWFTG
jgi:hypothetical protein